MYLLEIVECILFFYLVLICISSYGKKDWHNCNNKIVYIVLLLCILTEVYLPVESNTDKYRYISFFQNSPFISSSKDFGWSILTLLLYYITSANVTLYIAVLAFLYILSYYIFAKKFFCEEFIVYYILLSSCCLGFFGGLTNVIRVGTATSFFFLALVFKNSKILFVLFSIVAISVHASLLLVFLAFIFTSYYSNYKIYVLCWCLFVICSAFNILTPIISFLLSHFGDLSNRLGEYVNSEYDGYAKAGFRIDFIIYSAFPICYSYWILKKKDFLDYFYLRIVEMYIFVNCFWLVVIRIPYGDRFALLSWTYIPFIILYPYMNKGKKLNFDYHIILIILMPIVMNFLLILR